MSKKKPTTSIRVSKQARKILKLRAIQKGCSMIDCLDALLKNIR